MFDKYIIIKDGSGSLPSRERGLKCFTEPTICPKRRRSPRGSVDWNLATSFFEGSVNVAPLAGAWIEIRSQGWLKHGSSLSLPSRERGLKFCTLKLPPNILLSLPSRERGLKSHMGQRYIVRSGRSPRGSVDWNSAVANQKCCNFGRSPRGSVDWNSYHCITLTFPIFFAQLIFLKNKKCKNTTQML